MKNMLQNKWHSEEIFFSNEDLWGKEMYTLLYTFKDEKDNQVLNLITNSYFENNGCHKRLKLNISNRNHSLI